MDKHTEIIFNLFLIEFIFDYCRRRPEIYESSYNIALNTDEFKMIKDCFPINEVVIIYKQLDNYSECKYLGKKPEYKTIEYNQIKELNTWYYNNPHNIIYIHNPHTFIRIISFYTLFRIYTNPHIAYREYISVYTKTIYIHIYHFLPNPHISKSTYIQIHIYIY